MINQVIDKETAENEFNRFGECMALDFDVSSMDNEDKKGFEGQKRRIVNAIMDGSMIINDNGEPIFTPQRSGDMGAITFHEPTGATYMAMDRQKKDHDIGKLYSVMADMTKETAGMLSKLKGNDSKVCQAVVALFLA